MSASAVYVAIAVGVLAVLAILFLVVWRGGGERRLTPLAAFALTCVVCGIVFGEERVVGYAFFLVGILLAIVDAVRRPRKGHRPG
ncbi:MAG: hypothetical protein WCF04_14930 [Candidatus Nanopelagicales bacterium]